MNVRGSKGSRNVKYIYDSWVDETDGHLYVKTEAIEWERANLDGFQLGARRYTERYLARLGITLPKQKRPFKPLIEEWDRDLDWATDMLVAVVYRTVAPLPVKTDDEALARA